MTAHEGGQGVPEITREEHQHNLHAKRVVSIDASGNIVPTVAATSSYGINNTEDTGTYKYFGFESASGAWYIMRKTIATNTYLYSAGTSSYATAWTNRASQDYAIYGTTF